MTFENVIATLFFIVPGFIASKVKHNINTYKEKNTFVISLESVIYSFIVHSMVMIFLKMNFFEMVFQKENLSHVMNLDSMFLCFYIFGLSFLIGFFFGEFSKTPLYETVHEFIYPERSIFKSVWDEAIFENLNSKNNLYIEFKTKNTEEHYIGKIKSCTDIDKDNKELYLENIQIIDSKNNSKEVEVDSMIIDYANIEYIFFHDSGQDMPIKNRTQIAMLLIFVYLFLGNTIILFFHSYTSYGTDNTDSKGKIEYVSIDYQQIGIVTTSNLNIRKSNTIYSESVGHIKKGEMLVVLEEKSNWYRIIYKNQNGWVYKYHVDLRIEKMEVIQ